MKGAPILVSASPSLWLHAHRSMNSAGVSGCAALFEAECFFDFFFINTVVFCHFDHRVARPEAANNYLCGYGHPGEYRSPKGKPRVNYDGFRLFRIGCIAAAEREQANRRTL